MNHRDFSGIFSHFFPISSPFLAASTSLARPRLKAWPETQGAASSAPQNIGPESTDLAPFNSSESDEIADATVDAGWIDVFYTPMTFSRCFENG